MGEGGRLVVFYRWRQADVVSGPARREFVIRWRQFLHWEGTAAARAEVPFT